MPKLKTNRGAAKRFRRTAKGFKHKRTNKAHILTKMSPKRKAPPQGLQRRLRCGRGGGQASDSEEGQVRGR